MTRYKTKEEFELALTQAPSDKMIEIRNDAGTGNKPLPTMPYEMVREVAELMYNDVIIVKNTATLEPVTSIIMVEMEIMATPSYPDAKPVKLFANGMDRLLSNEGRAQDPYMKLKSLESVCYRDAFKREGNIFGRSLRSSHGADFSLLAKEAVKSDKKTKSDNTESPI